jgi:peptidoglycan/LPS O-acetylase OafA/YrhL
VGRDVLHTGAIDVCVGAEAVSRDAAAPRAPYGVVPDAVAAPPGNPRFPLVDSLRAIAALMVVAGHTLLVALGASVPGIFGGLGISGVAIFFVISGFLLYRPFVAGRLAGTGDPRLRDYARRRALRIFPAYWLAVSALALYPGLQGSFRGDGWVYYGLLQNWFPRLRTLGLPQAWTLSVEATFYVMLPLLGLAVMLVTRRLATRLRLSGEIALLAALVAIRLGYQVHPVAHLDTALYYLDWFLGGMALAVLSAAVADRGATPRIVAAAERRPELCWLLAAAVYCTFAFRLIHHEPTFRDHLLLAVFAVLVVIPGVFEGTGLRLVRAALRNRILAWLGLISYGLYLWHGPILTRFGETSWVSSLSGGGKLVVLTVTSFAITLVCASLSYYLLERPLLRYKRSGQGGAAPPPVALATQET